MRYSDLAVEGAPEDGLVAYGDDGDDLRLTQARQIVSGDAQAAAGESPVDDGWVDFAAGDRSEAAFLRRYAPLPEAEWYRSDHYTVYAWLLRDRHVVGQGRGGELERGAALPAVGPVEAVATAGQGV